MLAVNFDQHSNVVDKHVSFIPFPITVEVQPDPNVAKLLVDLSPDNPWGERQIAAKKLRRIRNPEALPGLMAALLADPFWMVRCAIVQALVMIGDPQAIPTLQEVAISDGFQVVRSYAGKAVKRLS